MNRALPIFLTIINIYKIRKMNDEYLVLNFLQIHSSLSGNVNNTL